MSSFTAINRPSPSARPLFSETAADMDRDINDRVDLLNSTLATKPKTRVDKEEAAAAERQRALTNVASQFGPTPAPKLSSKAKGGPAYALQQRKKQAAVGLSSDVDRTAGVNLSLSPSPEPAASKKRKALSSSAAALLLASEKRKPFVPKKSIACKSALPHRPAATTMAETFSSGNKPYDRRLLPSIPAV
ncbi:hypothetical protein LTR17_002544 [Elasticomyces elasticus]|nr:hypothetical protein LTR17_002544 [Elasticomyces elasticus]